MSDELDYDELGWTIATSGAYSTHGQPTAYRAIGYPLFVAGVYEIAGRRPTAVRLVQALCDSLSGLLLFYLLARRNAHTAVWLGASWAVFTPAILFANQIFSESIFVFVLVLFTYLLCRDSGREIRSIWVPGIVLGVLVLIKPAMLLFTVALPFALSKLHLRPAALKLIAWACIPIALWVGRNAIVMRAPVLTTSTGMNLLIGNNPRATGGYSLPDVLPLGSDERSADSAAFRIALEYVDEHPVRAVGTGIKKLLLLMSSEGELAVGNFYRQPSAFPVRFSEKLRAVPIWIRTLVSLPFALVLILGTLGLATRRYDLMDGVFWALLFGIVASSFIFFGGSRFHFPLTPFLAAFAAEFVTEGRFKIRTVGRWHLSLSVAACLVYVFVWAGEIYLLYES